MADVLGLLDLLDPERLAVVGLSLGGNIAQEVVRRAPGRVHALVIADATSNTASRPALHRAAAIAAVQYLAFYPRRLFLRAAVAVTARDPAARDYVRATTAAMSQRDVVRVLSSLLGAALRPEPDYRLPVPTLLLHGEHDHVGDIASGSVRWARDDHQIEHGVIPAASHLSNLDAPAAFNHRLSDFLDRHLPVQAEVRSVLRTWLAGLRGLRRLRFR